MTLVSRARAVLLMALLAVSAPVLAWDASGHRYTAYVAWEFMTAGERDAVISTLREHPRFEQDFMAQMPESVRDSDPAIQHRWLLGQAAFWPDMARGFSAANQRRYHRPNWHWIDGAWVRGNVEIHGNVYINTTPIPSIPGPLASGIDRESRADNVVTALEFSLHRYSSPSTATSDRAIALCWILHLVGDLHQPLHTGGAMTATLFADGDRGGNAVNVRGDSNLHAVWDRALRGLPFGNTLDELLLLAQEIRNGDQFPLNLDTELWLHESRLWLHEAVYTESLRSAIAAADASGDRLPPVSLDDDYVELMREVSRERIALSGVRLATIFGSPLIPAQIPASRQARFQLSPPQ